MSPTRSKNRSGDWGVTANGYRVSSGVARKVSELDRSDGYGNTVKALNAVKLNTSKIVYVM